MAKLRYISIPNKTYPKGALAMLNNQPYITKQLEKVLYEILLITSKRLKKNNKNFKHIFSS